MVGAEYRICEHISGVPMVTALGAIDAKTVDGFREVLVNAERRGTRGLIVFLEQATYLCKLAYETLALVHTRLTAQFPRMLIVVCSDEHAAAAMLRLSLPQVTRVPTLVAALHEVRAAGAVAFPDMPATAALNSSVWSSRTEQR